MCIEALQRKPGLGFIIIMFCKSSYATKELINKAILSVTLSRLRSNGSVALQI